MKKKPSPPVRPVHEWENVSFKVNGEMRKKIDSDMVVSDCHTLAEYFRFLLRTRFERLR
jgi:hypothetical protein